MCIHFKPVYMFQIHWNTANQDWKKMWIGQRQPKKTIVNFKLDWEGWQPPHKTIINIKFCPNIFPSMCKLQTCRNNIVTGRCKMCPSGTKWQLHEIMITNSKLKNKDLNLNFNHCQKNDGSNGVRNIIQTHSVFCCLKGDFGRFCCNLGN